MKTVKPMVGQLTIFELFSVAEVSGSDDTSAISNKNIAVSKDVTVPKKPSSKKVTSSRKKKELLSPLEKFINENDGRVIEDDGSFTSDDFKSYCRSLKSALNKEAKLKGFDSVSLVPGHYYMSGFFKKGDQYVYWSFSVARGDMPTYLDKISWGGGVLYRTAKSDKDFTGGHNNFCKLRELVDNAYLLVA